MDEAQDHLTVAEKRSCQSIRTKDATLRAFVERERLSDALDVRHWLRYLTGIKHSLGNLNNDIGFVATLLAKEYLIRRFGIADFDAAGKAQGASGIDILARTADGRTVVGELKTTKPYQPGFGAAQRASILKDLARLARTTSDWRFMFVIDPDAFGALCKSNFASKAPGVEIVDLVSEASFICK
ncbi:hypothetical protein [Bradyrhizobium sp. th.b2]|uniref:hypothetical protein n=1 Tax=Bradyrhizobium sp. th-b2 TaxID=172088 RepID=UPI000424CF79|nr:hypothetical protein [Bradyrhizobium sp. th.b2]